MSIYLDIFNPFICKAQIALLREELSEKKMTQSEADILSIYITELQQRLQEQEEKEQQVEQMAQQQYKEHQQPHFDGEA